MATYRNELQSLERLAGPPAGSMTRPRMGLSRAIWLGGMLLLSIVGGCTPAAHERLTGHWVGYPDDAANGLTTGQLSGDGSPSNVELELDFLESRRFVMAMRGVAADAQIRRGRFRVLRAHGTRWEIELAADDTPQTIRLELAFRDADHMTIREVEGDNRLSVFQLKRVSPAAAGEPPPSSSPPGPDV